MNKQAATLKAAKAAKPKASANGKPAAAKPRQASSDTNFAGLDRETLLDFLYQMVLIRRFEEKAEEGYKLGKIGGFLHLVIGQEAVCVGALGALRPSDHFIGSYREHGHAIAKGMPADEVMAELYGKAGGCSGGKGGSMHMFDAARNFYGGHGIVGGQIPLGTGIAFATKYLGKDDVTICTFGEAAVNQGAFHESLNMAALWDLPIIYICENNRYGMGTAIGRAMSNTDVAKKAEAYGMAHETVDGQDLIAVYEAVRHAAARARAESKPILLNILTYRYKGHSVADPDNTYRDAQEIEQYRQDDPIRLFADKLRAAKWLSDAEFAAIEDRAKAEVAQAHKFADESPLPDPAELTTHIYANPL
jgi:pyruvate dehydrogenase E1 component alpha subunit